MQKNDYYAQCLEASRAARNVADFGWDGETIDCGVTDILQGPAPPGSRRLLDAGSYGYGGDRGMPAGNYGYGSGSRDLPGSYGSAGGYGTGSRDLPGAYGYGSCDGADCKMIYEQCGGGMLDAVACCEEGTVCTKVSSSHPVSTVCVP